MSLSAFEGITTFFKEKFQDRIDIFMKVEIFYILTHVNSTSVKK